MFGGTAGDPSRIGEPALKCEESWNLDTKMDDGKPGMGSWILHLNVSLNCVTTSVRGTAEYRFTTSSPEALVDFQYVR